MKADPRIKLIELQAASCPTGLLLCINKMYKELKEQEESNYGLRQRIKNIYSSSLNTGNFMIHEKVLRVCTE